MRDEQVERKDGKKERRVKKNDDCKSTGASPTGVKEGMRMKTVLLVDKSRAY